MNLYTSNIHSLLIFKAPTKFHFKKGNVLLSIDNILANLYVDFVKNEMNLTHPDLNPPPRYLSDEKK